MDELLVSRLPQQEGILSYSTMELDSGNYGNLVLFETPYAKEQWGTNKMHDKAVELAPSYYESVRIYNGFLPEGILEEYRLELTLVNYFDFRSETTWRASRKL